VLHHFEKVMVKEVRNRNKSKEREGNQRGDQQQT
jgi:hypothetical protein